MNRPADIARAPDWDSPRAAPAAAESDTAFQARMLAGVSRTFALTIPELPPALSDVVANAYLLCRIVDTVEDEPDIGPPMKKALCGQFVGALVGTQPAEQFGRQFLPLLSSHSSPEEHELIACAERVVSITHRFTPSQQDALIECVAIMGAGMVEFQAQGAGGLAHLTELARYCYHVAGVVGEMLTKLFCEYSPDVARHRARLLELAVAFGQGLQMTNILKDIWDDQERGMCWLPRDLFARHGFDLADLTPGAGQPGFVQGLHELIAITHGHLQRALEYTLLLPARERAIRNFCLWSIGMALLTLRKLHARPGFASGQEVKISRRSVRATVLACRTFAGNDTALRLLFRAAASSLPQPTSRSLA